MNKVLYIGNFLDSSGYSVAIENSLKALYYNKVPVAARHISLVGNKREPDSIIKKLLETDASDADTLIIHSLPGYFEYDGRFKCIGRFDLETNSLVPSCWKKKISLMDEVWVTSQHARYVLEASDIKIPVKVVPHPVNPLRFEDNVGGISLEGKMRGQVSKLKGPNTFLFYTVGEWVSRKNYEDMIKGWYLSFGKTDNVDLVIKTGKSGISPQALKEICLKTCEHVKGQLKLNGRFLKDPIFITEHWTDDQIDELHKVGDCFISTSHGEGWCQPALDACCFGKFVLVPDKTAFQDYVTDDWKINNDYNGFFIKARKAPCYGAVDSPKDMYSAHNSWYNIDLGDLISKFKQVYENQTSTKAHGLFGKALIEKYSYSTVGALMKSLLPHFPL